LKNKCMISSKKNLKPVRRVSNSMSSMPVFFNNGKGTIIERIPSRFNHIQPLAKVEFGK